MKRLAIVVSVLLFSVSVAFAAPKTYQVTGPVLEVKDDSITVLKGKEKWQISRDKDTKIKGDLKVGSKATIEYNMKATAVDVKDAAAKKAEPKKK